jgi:phosphatidylserine/phosphatidylglycerophosphate/cardiolipin synthase-like enzyme
MLGLNTHVSYVHSKFLLVDPLSDDPIVVTGSANFSKPSTTENDENMIVVRGDRRTADIYLTEFNRIFNHYYFRSVTEATAGQPQSVTDASLFLAENASWQQKYEAGSLRAKRLALYASMSGFTRA